MRGIHQMGSYCPPDKPQHTHRPLLPWLLGAFKAWVAECEKQDVQGWPPLYAIHKMFWFEWQSTTFLFKRSLTSPTLLHNPHFFLWDPKALYKDLLCPICCWVLQCHDIASQPQWCVDMTSEFYIIGYQYQCANCLNPKMKKKTVTFQSWDSHILAVLPSALAAEFPAYLSHQSGMLKALFSWIWMCFSSGIGATLWNPWPVEITSHPRRNAFLLVFQGVDKEKPISLSSAQEFFYWFFKDYLLILPMLGFNQDFFPVLWLGVFLPVSQGEYADSGGSILC